jgi:hemolysin III
MSEATAVADVRPSLRGVVHRWAAIVFAILFVALVAIAPDGAARAAVAIYGVCVTAMLAISATYHSGRIGPVGTRRLKRADHATILLAIAGTYTAVTALALDGTERVVMLVVVWAAAVIGIAVRMLWLDAPYPVVAAVYLAVGWLALVDLPGYMRTLSGGQEALIVLGGLLYTAGGVIYALHRPNPWPATFGYHEVFHTLVVAGAAAHLAAVWAIVAAR